MLTHPASCAVWQKVTVMRTIETIARVSEDGTLTLRVPPGVTPGDHQVVLVIDEEPTNGISEETVMAPLVAAGKEPAARGREGWRGHYVGPWPEGPSLRREDMYDDWGR